MGIFLEGFLMGFAYIAPIGMENLFLIDTALTQKRRRVWLTVLIVLIFDISLSLACFFGIGVLMEKSKILEMIVLLVGSIIVAYIGIGLFKQTTSKEKQNVDIPILKIITTAFVVTWFNPQAIIDGTMMLGAFKATLSQVDSYKFILGVNIASCVWFFGMTTLINIIKDKFTYKALNIINKVCGVILVFYAIKLFINFIMMIHF
ncbi:LysE/ArgO family amino acid transporter [Clostridium thermobutyricum]|uniref:Arginine exporter protein ArgO n=1 Tax=Clostridium thermobutyricum DSM 4928 TaxID=1121339 RepID=A0A1V4SUL9_9CLOT|nr:LysE family transporter [Clostridium thermobutyricum]OPX47618.1 arginine exporter protein ArgO [Clostridium thermobutyricum DSM 4928]